jgi:DNA-binding MarR family transcriptional regulator
MSNSKDSLAITLFSELFMVEQLAKAQLTRALPKGMEFSQFSVLNHLAGIKESRTPAQIARTFNLTKGAMTNTLTKLDWAGHISITPDWADARRKLITLSPSGRSAQDTALKKITPLIDAFLANVGVDRLQKAVPVLRDLRIKLNEGL